MKKTILKKVWGFLVNPVSVQTPLTKITKKIGNRIINTQRDTNINNQLILFLFVHVNKYYCFKRCISWNI